MQCFQEKSIKSPSNIQGLTLEGFRDCLKLLHQTKQHGVLRHFCRAFNLTFLFKLLDVNHDNLLSADEFLQGVALLSVGEWQEVLTLAVQGAVLETNQVSQINTASEQY